MARPIALRKVVGRKAKVAPSLPTERNRSFHPRPIDPDNRCATQVRRSWPRPRFPERLLPYDEAAERAVLGVPLLIGKIPAEAQAVKESDFHTSAHALIWGAFKVLESEGAPIDPISVKNVLARVHPSSEVHRVAIDLGQVFDEEFTDVNVRYYVTILKQKSLQRSLIQTLNELLQRAWADGHDRSKLLAELEERLVPL